MDDPDDDNDDDEDGSEEDDEDVDEEDLPWCNYDADFGGEGEQGGNCRERNLTPWKKYKGYNQN